MRIGCLQFAPQVGDVDNNLNRADSVLNRVPLQELEDLDLLVLPEMAFSGYNFKSLAEITPFLEPSGSGISALWARTTALKYNCKVVVGYPEKVDVTKDWPTSPQYYNSLLMVNEEGETIATYRKSFLYKTDETWALEGPGFFAGEIEDLGQTSIGICMDINPYKFESPFHAFEFAFHVLDSGSKLVIISQAWNTFTDRSIFFSKPDEPDMESISYWAQRMEPLIRDESDEEVILVFANRCGIEDDATYVGSSAVLGIVDGEVNVYGFLGRNSKDLLIVDTDELPWAKLVNRPGRVEEEEEAEAEWQEGEERMEGMEGEMEGVEERLAREEEEEFGAQTAMRGGVVPTREEDVYAFADGEYSDESPISMRTNSLPFAQSAAAARVPPPPPPLPAQPYRYPYVQEQDDVDYADEPVAADVHELMAGDDNTTTTTSTEPAAVDSGGVYELDATEPIVAGTAITAEPMPITNTNGITKAAATNPPPASSSMPPANYAESPVLTSPLRPRLTISTEASPMTPVKAPPPLPLYNGNITGHSNNSNMPIIPAERNLFTPPLSGLDERMATAAAAITTGPPLQGNGNGIIPAAIPPPGLYTPDEPIWPPVRSPLDAVMRSPPASAVLPTPASAVLPPLSAALAHGGQFSAVQQQQQSCNGGDSGSSSLNKQQQQAVDELAASRDVLMRSPSPQPAPLPLPELLPEGDVVTKKAEVKVEEPQQQQPNGHHHNEPTTIATTTTTATATATKDEVKSADDDSNNRFFLVPEKELKRLNGHSGCCGCDHDAGAAGAGAHAARTSTPPVLPPLAGLHGVHLRDDRRSSGEILKAWLG